MVDLVEIQATYYMVAATGVLVATMYYIMNLRETRRNGRITLTNNLIQMFFKSESNRITIELLHTEWTDYSNSRESTAWRTTRNRQVNGFPYGLT